jgi:hypothetical protein
MLLEKLRNTTKGENEPIMSRKKKSTVILPPPIRKSTELTPFLKMTDISKDGTTPITLLGDMRQSKSRFGDGIEVACMVGGKRFTWTIKFDSGNYTRLYERFGTKNWKGVVNVERKEYMGREYIAVVD